MLDKTIEFHSIIMRHQNNKPPMLPDIPEGYSIRFYDPVTHDYVALGATVGKAFSDGMKLK